MNTTTKFSIWYVKPQHGRDARFGEFRPNPQDLAASHVHLKDIELQGGSAQLERIFEMMQGEIWSPNGEARDLIRSKGLEHTSMSVGDVVVIDDTEVAVVAPNGFDFLVREGEEAPGFDDVEGAVEKANDIWAQNTFKEG